MRARSHSLIEIIRQFANDTRGGAMLILCVLLTVFVLGTGGLILDTGRVLNEQSELQTFADMTALTAAGELDGRPDAITRANSAVAQLMQDRQSYGAGGNDLTSNDVTLTFYTDLPALDTTPLDANDITNLGAEARFVESAVTPHTVTSIFLNALTALSGGGATTVNVEGRAVAGWTQYQCDITPLMFCVPDGMSGAAARTWLPGRQIRLKSQSSWGPGAFGLLDVNFDPEGPCGNPNTGADYFRCAVAAESSITKCFSKNGVDVRPGQAAGPSESGFNARFDIYTTSLNSKKNDPLFRPAPNVIKGIKPNGGGSCIGQNANNLTSPPYAPGDPIGLPIEDCLISESCAAAPGGRFGNLQIISATQRDAYTAENYVDLEAPIPANVDTATSRYDIYLDEITAGDGMAALPMAHDEDGAAMCATGSSPDPDRRVVTAAAVDCATLPPGNASNVSVLDFYRMFLTNPAGFDPTVSTLSDNVSLWVEVIEHIDPFGGGGSTGGFVRDFVQLYR